MRTHMLIVAASLLTGMVCCAGNEPADNRGWTFAEESVLLEVEDGFFRVSVEYVFRVEPGSEPLGLLLSFPEDESIGEPVLLESALSSGDAVEPLPVLVGPDGWRFVLPRPGPAGCAVMLSYYQPFTGTRAVYVLRSVREWGRPLERAALEVRVPEGKACAIGPALEAAGIADGAQVFRSTFEDWIPHGDLVVDLLES